MVDCVGCGFCCLKAPCIIAVRLYGPISKCPLLIWDKEKKRHLCKLCILPGELGERYRKELYIGEGCCCSLCNDWRDNIQDRTGSEKNKFIELDKYFKIFLHCISKQWISGDTVELTLYAMKDSLERSNVSKEESEEICKEIRHIFKQNKASYLEGFI